MKKVAKISFKALIIALCVSFLFFCSFAIYSLTVLRVPLDISRITETSLKIDVYNSQGLEIKELNKFNNQTATLEQIPEHVKQAFVSIEDKNFYEHKGINLARMTKAVVNNIKSCSAKEGASTITQQLIKNTHLSSEKKLPRKFNEIRLALELEKNMTKDKILTNYLNVIYFGNNCYGLEEASEYYFSKPTNQLNLQEGATLAGIIKSPNYYSPIKHSDRALTRRNLVLKEMAKDGKISAIECVNAQSQPLNLKINSQQKNKLNSYSQSAIDEACAILNLPERQIAIGGYKIYTYQDLDKQIKLQNLVDSTTFESDFALIDVDAKTCGVSAYLGKSDYKILDAKRQIGSIAKPLFVYGPAINENILTPASVILDEPITIGGYSPKNVTGTYSGYVSARTALSKSLNIPAVKTASYVGINKIASYAQKLGLPLDESDYSYSVALGGVTYGYNLKDVCGGYSALVNNGIAKTPKFVKYITNANGDIVYKNQSESTQVFRDDTSYLITDILKTCAKSGTAKKLGDLPFEVASKTGTVGSNNGNLDAYNISYTTEDIVGVWFGNMDNTLTKIAGGNQPTALAKEYYKKIYSTHKPANFEVPSSVEKVDINQYELDTNHILLRANSFTPQKDVKTEVFSRFNLPKEQSLSSLNQPLTLIGYVENGKAILKFSANSQATYKLYKKVNNKNELLKTFSNQNGNVEFCDEVLPINQKTTYLVTTEIVDLNGKVLSSITSNEITLINLNSSQNYKDKWYI